MARLIVFLAVLAILSGSALTAPSCTSIIADVAPCLNYLKGNVKQPSQSCCSGVKDVSNAVKTKADRQSVCNCLKETLSKIGSYDKTLMPTLPKKCGASADLPAIDKNTDCSKVMFYLAL